MRNCNYMGVFYALLQAGLWEKDVQLLQYGRIDFKEVIQLAEEQSVVGLITAGLEHVKDTKVPHDNLIPFIGRTLQIEQRNKAMNEFIAKLMNLLNKNGIKALLVKGQGVAQCYERPLWRACGDVDLLLDDENYQKAKDLLIPLASSVDEENSYNKHIATTIKGCSVELHGTLRSGLWLGIDKMLDRVQDSVFYESKVRLWLNDKTEVLLPNVDEDVVFIFTHILQHFYKEGVGLRQICDWCRLLWAYRDSINMEQLEKRIRKMGLTSEWKAFASFAIYYLGMPVEAMPFFDVDHNINHNDNRNLNINSKYRKKAKRINKFILQVGNMGHNRDYSYYTKYPYVIFKTISLWRHIKDSWTYFSIFPLDSIKVTWSMLLVGFTEVLKGGFSLNR